MMGLYGGFSVVCAGAFMMKAPKELYPDGEPPVSPAVSCTMQMAVQYFLIYVLLAVTKTINEWTGKTHSKFADVLSLAAYTVNLAPMLCVLFIGARMRALQIDPLNGSPQPWAQKCFYLCTYS